MTENESELEARLRQHLTSGAPRIDIDEVMQVLDAPAALPPGRSTLRWGLTAFGVSAGIATGFLIASLMSTTPSPQAVGSPASSSADTTASPSRVGWMRSVLPGAVRETVMTSVAWNGTTYVATGSSQVQAAIWTSNDGVGWERARSLPDVDGVYLLDLIGTDEGFLAVGYRSNFPSTLDEAVVWRSSDGTAWHAVPDQPSLVGGGHMAEVAEEKGRYVAVGVDDAHGALAAWTSNDGQQWTDAQAPVGGPGSSIADITAFGGGFIAVGQDIQQTGEVGAVWRSSDGTSWQRVRADFGPGALTGLTQLSDQLVAVGGDGERATAWASDDGQSWRARPAPPTSGLVALTTEGSDLFVAPGQPTTAQLWRSSDGGSSWREVPGLAARTGDSIRTLAAGRSVVAVGDDGFVPLTWREP